MHGNSSLLGVVLPTAPSGVDSTMSDVRRLDAICASLLCAARMCSRNERSLYTQTRKAFEMAQTLRRSASPAPVDLASILPWESGGSGRS